MSSTATDRRYGINSGLAIKAPCVALATSNITLSGLQTIGSYTTAVGDRVLCIGQTDPTTNGIYQAQTSSWIRDIDFDGNYDITSGTVCVYVSSGSVYFYGLTTVNPITIGSSALTFSLIAAINLTGPTSSTLIGDTSAGTNPQISTVSGRLNSLAYTGQVTMIRTGTSTWSVFNEYMNPIPTAGTTTSGLQEAENYRYANGLNLVVRGGTSSSAAADYGIINATTQVKFNPIRAGSVIIDAHLESTFTGDAVVIDSMMEGQFTWTGEVVALSVGASNYGVRVKPQTAIPVDGRTVLTASRLKLPSVVTASGSGGDICFDPTVGSIVNNEEISVIEPNGGLVGFKVLNSGSISLGFFGNTIRIAQAHSCAQGMQIGQSSTFASNLGPNTYLLGSVQATTGIGFESYASGDTVIVDSLTTAGSASNTCVLRAGANNNRIIAGTFGTGTATDAGAANRIEHDGQTFFGGLQSSPNFVGGSSTDSTSGASVITAAQIVNGILIRSGSGAATDTTDTAAAIIAAIPGCFGGQRIPFVYANENGAQMVLAGGSGVTVPTNPNIAANSTRTFTLLIDNVASPALRVF